MQIYTDFEGKNHPANVFGLPKKNWAIADLIRIKLMRVEFLIVLYFVGRQMDHFGQQANLGKPII